MPTGIAQFKPGSVKWIPSKSSKLVMLLSTKLAYLKTNSGKKEPSRKRVSKYLLYFLYLTINNAPTYVIAVTPAKIIPYKGRKFK